MKYSLFIVTFSRDLPYIPLLLKSVSKFVGGVDEVVILVPPKDKPMMDGFGLTKERVVFVYEPLQDGHLNQQLFKCNADYWCKGDYIIHVDSDCLFTAPVTPVDYFRCNQPILIGTKYDELNAGKPWPGASPWRPCTERCLGEPVDYETMRRLPVVYNRNTYIHFRKHVKATHGVELADYLRPLKGITPNPIQSFSEFCALGAYSWKHLAHLYYLWDTAKGDPPPSNLAQFWSRGGLDWLCDHGPFEGQSYRQVAEKLLS